MWRRTFTRQQAHAIYTVLVTHAGAREGADRSEFVYHAVNHGITEYRFMGDLGFGGKFYDDIRVSCYPEDLTDERRAIIEETNRALSNLDLRDNV